MCIVLLFPKAGERLAAVLFLLLGSRLAYNVENCSCGASAVLKFVLTRFFDAGLQGPGFGIYTSFFGRKAEFGGGLGLGICLHAEVFRPLTAEAFPVKA